VSAAIASGAPTWLRPILVVPKPSDPRVTIAAALTAYTVLGQTVLFFNRDVAQLVTATLTACLVDAVLAYLVSRVLLVPLSAYITGLSLGILLESYDPRVHVLAAVWAIASKYLVRDREGHIFNPSNFGVVAMLVLGRGLASVAPGSQWGGRAWPALIILALGLMMMRRIGRLDLVATWIAGYIVMGMARLALGQGGIVFALGPMAGAEFALFSFSMLPDPKTSPPTPRGRVLWGAGIAITDGILRYLEVRYSMFFALFGFCAALPLVRRMSRSGPGASARWDVIERRLGRS
jgi:Na+-translocating ferredoxin:NAD+ oxidoreductase RnfD subunit